MTITGTLNEVRSIVLTGTSRTSGAIPVATFRPTHAPGAYVLIPRAVTRPFADPPDHTDRDT